MRAGVPVIPIAVVGAEESMPILFKSTRLAKVLNIPYFPITANMLVFGPGRARRVLPREVQDPRAAAGALRRPARTRSATRAAG